MDKITFTFNEELSNTTGVCNNCGQSTIIKYRATVHPFVNSETCIRITACSDKCRDELLQLDKGKVHQALLEVACEIAESTAEELNDQYKVYIDNIA